MKINDTKFLQELREQAWAMYANPTQTMEWTETYKELAMAADRLHAMLKRAMLKEKQEDKYGN